MYSRSRFGRFTHALRVFQTRSDSKKSYRPSPWSVWLVILALAILVALEMAALLKAVGPGLK